MIELLLEAERALEMGRVDAAETMYRQVADADPRNAIAVVGLARVALERGDEAGALELAGRALAIDPENAAAGRMVTRLEEVITYRGETVSPPAPAAERGPTAAVPTGPDAVPPPAVPAGPDAGQAPSEAEAPAAEPQPALAAEPERASPAPAPEPPGPARRRSWIDRLLRRNR